MAEDTWGFILFFMFMQAFILWILPLTPFPQVIYTTAGLTPEAPSCAFTGTWADLLAVVVCGINGLVYFFSFLGLSVAVGYGWLTALLFTPMLITMLWVFIVWLRG